MTYNEFLLGKRTRLSWVDETSFGVGGNMAANGEVVGLNAVIEPDFNQNWQEILSDGQDGRTILKKELGPLDLPFTLTFTPVDYKFLRYLGYDFNNVEIGETGIFNHTGSLQNSIQSFKLEWAIFHNTPVVINLSGATVMSGTINFAKATGEGEGMITVTLNCYAKSYGIGDSVTALAKGNITRSPLHFRNVKITQNDLEVVEVNNGEITIDQDIDPNDSRYCNATLDREVGEFIPKVHRITGRYNFNLKDNTFFNQWASGDVIPDCKLEFIKEANDELSLTLNGFRIGQGIPPIALEGVMNTDVVWQCNKFDPIIAKDNLNNY